MFGFFRNPKTVAPKELESFVIHSLKVHALHALGLLAHLVSRFACNTRVILDASLNPPVSRLKLLQQKKLESSHHVNKQELNVTSSINQMVIR